MKKVLYVLLGFVVLILAAAVLVPILFKDKIKEKIDAEIAKSVNAEVYFDADKFSLSLFRNFPNASVSLHDFGVVGREEFEGDTLIAVSDFTLVIDIKSVLFGDELHIKAIDLVQPKIQVLVLENGKANYDIMISDTTQVEEVSEEGSEDFKLGIDSWTISDGEIAYIDESLKFMMSMKSLNHSGSGDFGAAIFDMVTQTSLKNLNVIYEDVAYISDKSLDADITMSMDLDKFQFAFKDNQIKLNEFAFGFSGLFGMPENGFDLDIQFDAKENSFKNLLSLVPGIYTDEYHGLEANGTVGFNGFVKGMYTDSLMPAFQLNMQVKDGSMKYTDLPSSVTNIQLDMLVDNASGIIDETLVDIKNFHMDMGSNPFNGKVRIEGLDKMKVLADINAKLNLGEINQMFPIEGLEMKGLFAMNLKANGTYDEATSKIPVIEGSMSMADGYFKTSEFPVPIEEMSFIGNMSNTSGKMAETNVDISEYKMKMDGEEFHAKLHFENLDDYTWNLFADGTIDLQTISKIYPIEGMELSGKIKANIITQGKMSDVDAERYDKLPTRGIATVTGLKMTSTDLPQGLTIEQSEISLAPEKIVVKSYSGTLGKSDIQLDGYFANYIAYALKDNEVLVGELNLRSTKFDVNEWMVEDTTASTAPSDTMPLTVVEIPKTLNFRLKSEMKEVIYTNMVLSDLKGTIRMKDGIMSMEGVTFNSLGGQFGLSGLYDTQDLEHPKFDFEMDIKNLAFNKAYETFNTVKTLAPIAERIEGTFDSKFKLNGEMGQDMMPIYSSLLGGGMLKVAQASLTESKVISGVNSLTKMGGKSDGVTLKDVLVQAEVKEGRLHVKPFDVNIGGNKTNISGSNGIDGSLNYFLKMDMDAGAAGSMLNSAISSVSGNAASGSKVKVNFKVGGNYADPKVSLAGSEAGESTGSVAKDAVKGAVDEQKEKAQEELDKQKAEAEKKAKEEAAKAKAEAERKAKEEAEKLKKKAKDKLKDAIGG